MNTLFLGIVIFLIVLAVFDLVVGVSNDAVNFLNSAIGAKVARYRTVVKVAAIGVFAGAALSNGMMDVSRHGIMTPENASLLLPASADNTTTRHWGAVMTITTRRTT